MVKQNGQNHVLTFEVHAELCWTALKDTFHQRFSPCSQESGAAVPRMVTPRFGDASCQLEDIWSWWRESWPVGLPAGLVPVPAVYMEVKLCEDMWHTKQIQTTHSRQQKRRKRRQLSIEMRCAWVGNSRCSWGSLVFKDAASLKEELPMVVGLDGFSIVETALPQPSSGGGRGRLGETWKILEVSGHSMDGPSVLRWLWQGHGRPATPTGGMWYVRTTEFAGACSFGTLAMVEPGLDPEAKNDDILMMQNM